MTCEHRSITTWEFEGGKSAGLWSCAECKQKFVPITEMFDAVAAEREACARVCWNAGLAHEVRQGADLCFELSEAIRARGDA